MKRLSGVLIAVAILIIGLGFYRGWFALSRRAPEAGSNRVNINLATDPDKMKQDAKIVTDKATDLTDRVRKDVESNGPAHANAKSK